MQLRQRQFLPYRGGAPSIHTLSGASSSRHVLATTDRSASLLEYVGGQYRLRRLGSDDLSRDDVEIVASGVIEAPGDRDRAVIAYLERDKLFLQLWPLSLARTAVSFPHRAPSTPTKKDTTMRFELSAAPSAVVSVKARSTTGPEVFHGVLLCRSQSMTAFGYVDDRLDTTTPSTQCVRLTNDQFAAFFPEFDEFHHQVLAVDTLLSTSDERGYIVFGCAEGFVRVFRGHLRDGIVTGPLEARDLQMSGPVTSVSLFQPFGSTACSLLLTCAVGRAVVVDGDVFDLSNKPEELRGADKFDSIFSGAAADIDLDGELELLIGTDHEQVLAYKLQSASVSPPSSSAAAVKNDGDGPTSHPRLMSVESEDDSVVGLPIENVAAADMDTTTAMADTSAVEIPSDANPSTLPAIEFGDEPSPSTTRVWRRMPLSAWHFDAFGAIYSLLWRDVNLDGVHELLVASATGVYVLEADVAAVLQRLDQVLGAV